MDQQNLFTNTRSRFIAQNSRCYLPLPQVKLTSISSSSHSSEADFCQRVWVCYRGPSQRSFPPDQATSTTIWAWSDWRRSYPRSAEEHSRLCRSTECGHDHQRSKGWSRCYEEAEGKFGDFPKTGGMWRTIRSPSQRANLSRLLIGVMEKP